MKKVILCTVLLFFAAVSFGQQINAETKKPSTKKLYVQAGAGVTNSGGASFDFGLQSILKSNWTASASYKHVEMKPKNLPKDYEREVTYLILFVIYDEWPYNKMDIINFTLGKYIETGRKTWFTAEGGLSFVNGEELTFTSKTVVSNILNYSSNYSYKKENKTGFGVMLKTDFNWAILPFAGLGASVFANLNSVQSPIGFELKFICGHLYNKRKK